MTVRQRIKFIKKHHQVIGFFSTVDYFIKRALKGKNELISIKVPGLLNPIFLRNKTYDIHIFFQIFIAGELEINYDNSIKTIIDCGANIGLSTLYYRRKFPEAVIFSIEPEQNNFALLEENTKSYSNITCIKMGVYGKNCNLYLIDIGEGEASYQVSEKSDKGIVLNTIQCKTIDSIMEEFKIQRIDILKMDIEGSEDSCLLTPQLLWIKKTKYLLVEIHENLRTGMKEEILNFMNKDFLVLHKGEYTIFKNELC